MNNEKTNSKEKEISDEVLKIIDIIGKPNDVNEETLDVKEFLLEMNSLKFIELVTAIENKFHITLTSDEMMNFKSGEIEGIVEIIKNKLKITVEEREKNV